MKVSSLLPLCLLLAPAAQAQAQQPPAGREEIVSGLNRFGWDMFAHLRDQRGDLAFSPASASTAFGLAYAGARGDTADQIARVLHYPALADFHGTFGAVLKSLQMAKPGRTLAINNALWVHNSTAIRPDYAALVQRDYGAGLQRVDFKTNKQRASAVINAWVEARTNKRIRGLIGPNDIKRDTRAILLNTVYLKADWPTPFDPAATKAEAFNLAGGGAIKLPLMHRYGDYAFAEEGGVKAIAMPYRGGELEMIALLPAKAEQIGALERSLDSAAFDGWVKRLVSAGARPVNLTLPRFTLKRRLNLASPLIDLGMRIPFTDDSDFSGMKVVNAGSSDREEWNFKLSDAVQQVFVQVDERGTEAAAATALPMVIVTAVRIPVEFRADHPFLFAIRDRRSGALLFIGRFSGEAES